MDCALPILLFSVCRGHDTSCPYGLGDQVVGVVGLPVRVYYAHRQAIRPYK